MGFRTIFTHPIRLYLFVKFESLYPHSKTSRTVPRAIPVTPTYFFANSSTICLWFMVFVSDNLFLSSIITSRSNGLLLGDVDVAVDVAVDVDVDVDVEF